MTTPPNYRRVECCGNCKNSAWSFDYGTDFAIFICLNIGIHGDVEKDHICDDYEPEDGDE